MAGIFNDLERSGNDEAPRAHLDVREVGGLAAASVVVPSLMCAADKAKPSPVAATAGREKVLCHDGRRGRIEGRAIWCADRWCGSGHATEEGEALGRRARHGGA